MEEEESEPLSQVQHQQCRSQVARCLFLTQDRADMTFIVNELCQKMLSPNQQSLANLKRLARYLKRERQWRLVFEYGKLAEELTAFTDSDWAGCKETRKSSSAGVPMLGGHHESTQTKAEGHCKEQCRGQNSKQQHWERRKRREPKAWCATWVLQ